MSKYIVTDVNTGKEISPGDTVKNFRGETGTFKYVSRGPNHCGTARVIVSNGDSLRTEFYDRVWDLKVELAE